MTDRILHKLSHGLGKAIIGCEKFMTFVNDLHNDSGLIPPLDPLMQVQEPTVTPTESCENPLFPWLSFLNILLATVMLGHGLYQLCRPLTWYYGYEFKRCCSLLSSPYSSLAMDHSLWLFVVCCCCFCHYFGCGGCSTNCIGECCESVP